MAICDARALICQDSLYFQTAHSYSLCRKIVLLLHKAPTLQRHGTLWLYHFPEPRQAVTHGPVNDGKTPHTETLSGAGLICNASRYAIITGEVQTLADVQGGQSCTICIFTYLTNFPLWLNRKCTSGRRQCRWRSNKLTRSGHSWQSQLIFDLDSPLHIHRTSLRQERRTHWHFTGDIILCTIPILAILLLFRSYFVKLVQHCCPTNERSRKLLNNSPHISLLSLRKEHMSLDSTTYKGMLLPFMYTAR